MYRSSAKLQIIEEDRVGDVLGTRSAMKDDQILSKEVELLKSDVLFKKVVSRLNLETSIYAEGEILTKDLYRSAPFEVIIYKLKDSSILNKRIDLKLVNDKIQLSLNDRVIGATKLNEHIDNRYFDLYFREINKKHVPEFLTASQVFFKVNDKKALAKELRTYLNVSIIDEKAKTIELSYEYYNAHLCFDIINELLNEYLQWERDSKQNKVNKTIDFINTQIDSLSTILKQSKDSLNNYRRETRILNPESIGIELSDDIGELSKMIVALDEELLTLNLISNKINKNPNRLEIYRLIPEMVGKKSFEQTLVNQIEKLNNLLEKKDDLLREITNENIQIVIINEKIKNAISSINVSMEVIEERINNDREIISSKLKTIESEYFDLPEKKMEYERLKYMEDLNNQYFTLFTQKKIEYELSKAGYSTSNRILTAPELSKIPISPNHNLIYILAIILGFLIGLGLMVFRYVTYNDILSVSDLQKLLPENANFLGAVPLYKKKMKYSQVVVSESSKSRMAEAIRSIRSNMSFVNKEAKVVAISSSISGEGKTFVIINLAGLIAANGKKTIVLDLDLRKPKIHHGFGTENGDGMSNVISGLSAIEDVIQHSEIPNLDFVTAGPIAPNPSELIQSNELTEIISDLKKKYDIVMIDNPPVGIVSDGIKMLG